jgi:hypothetical protein
MKTPLETLLEVVELVPTETITKQNLIYTINNLLEVERLHLMQMVDFYGNTLNEMGMRVERGEQVVKRIYNKQ